jgi:hypothetical protein
MKSRWARSGAACWTIRATLLIPKLNSLPSGKRSNANFGRKTGPGIAFSVSLGLWVNNVETWYDVH